MPVLYILSTMDFQMFSRFQIFVQVCIQQTFFTEYELFISIPNSIVELVNFLMVEPLSITYFRFSNSCVNFLLLLPSVLSV